MEILNAYTETIFISVIIMVSYFFSYIAKKTNIPSVLLLIGMGVGVQLGLSYFKIDVSAYMDEALELLGVVGLIMIVLEAALDLKLSKKNRPLLINSFLMALFSLVATALIIGFVLTEILAFDFYTALVYAIPLSILSSAIIIPSVANLGHEKKEFLIYESTFSDILGIMFFYFLIGNLTSSNTFSLVANITGNIVLTITLAFIISYLLVLLLQRLTGQVKLFFLIAVLLLLYSVGKMFHLSSLVIILVFGLLLNNHKVFFRGKIASWVNEKAVLRIKEDFHLVTMESAFVVRTFFFVVFGMTIDFSGITDLPSIYLSLGILTVIYIVRFVFLLFFNKKKVLPHLWVAPRGLITVLLFFAIPLSVQSSSFNTSILLILILASGLVLTSGLVFDKGEEPAIPEKLHFDDWEVLDAEIDSFKKNNRQKIGDNGDLDILS